MVYDNNLPLRRDDCMNSFVTIFSLDQSLFIRHWFIFPPLNKKIYCTIILMWLYYRYSYVMQCRYKILCFYGSLFNVGMFLKVFVPVSGITIISRRTKYYKKKSLNLRFYELFLSFLKLINHNSHKYLLYVD